MICPFILVTSWFVCAVSIVFCFYKRNASLVIFLNTHFFKTCKNNQVPLFVSSLLLFSTSLCSCPPCLSGKIHRLSETETDQYRYINRFKIIEWLELVPRLWVMTLWKIFAVDTQFKQLRKRSLKKILASAGFEPVTSCDTGAVLYQLSYEAITVGEQVNFSGSIMPLRVIQHYTWLDLYPQLWVNDVSERSSRWIRNCKQLRKRSLHVHRYRRGHGFESRWSLNFFQASLSQLLKLRINREDLSWRHLLITAVQTQSL